MDEESKVVELAPVELHAIEYREPEAWRLWDGGTHWKGAGKARQKIHFDLQTKQGAEKARLSFMPSKQRLLRNGTEEWRLWDGGTHWKGAGKPDKRLANNSFYETEWRSGGSGMGAHTGKEREKPDKVLCLPNNGFYETERRSCDSGMGAHTGQEQKSQI